MTSRKRGRGISVENCSVENSQLPYLPDELLLFNVLPRLPLKSLCAFKTVCQKWRRLISSDRTFALEQSRHSSSSSSNVLVYRDSGGDIAFLSTVQGSPAGIPDVDSSSLLPPGYSLLKILSSLGGLLCLLVGLDACDSERFLCVCNPATRRGEMVPRSRLWAQAQVGLAIGPSASPAGSYKLVSPRWMPHLAEVLFAVFSSDTGMWVCSCRKLDNLTSSSFDGCFGKSVFVRGVLYWDCLDLLIWYDPETGSAGWVQLPPKTRSPHHQHHLKQEIGGGGGQVTCTRVWNETVEVWTMRGGRWERTHHVRNWLGMVEGSLLEAMSWRSRRETEVRPLPFQGGERVHLRVGTKGRGRGGKLICLDMRTGKAEELCEVMRLTEEESEDWVFPYHCSIICLPDRTSCFLWCIWH